MAARAAPGVGLEMLGLALPVGALQPAAAPGSAMACRAAMRFSVAGWVEKRLSMRSPVSGLTIGLPRMPCRCAIVGMVAKVTVLDTCLNPS